MESGVPPRRDHQLTVFNTVIVFESDEVTPSLKKYHLIAFKLAYTKGNFQQDSKNCIDVQYSLQEHVQLVHLG